MAKKKQSIPDGAKVTFDTKGLETELSYDSDITIKGWKKLDGCTMTVHSLATYGDLGDKDSEYYNVILEDGREIDALSGYHLELID